MGLIVGELGRERKRMMKQTTAPIDSDDAAPNQACPAASLIICSRNRPQLLQETIESVLAGTDVPTEIVVIDQSELPHPILSTLKADRGCTVTYRWTNKPGVSRARNEGAVIAQHDMLVLIDDDMFVAPDWFGALTRDLLNAGICAVVTGRVLTADEEGKDGFAPSTIADLYPAVYAGRVRRDVLYSGNMVIQRSVLMTIGGFDERLGPGTYFPAAEDNDLCFRLLEAGYRVIYAPDAVVYHRPWRASNDHLRLQRNYGLGQGGFYAKHLDLRDRYMLKRFGSDVAGHVLRSLRLSLRNRACAEEDMVYALGVVTGATRWLLFERAFSRARIKNSSIQKRGND